MPKCSMNLPGEAAASFWYRGTQSLVIALLSKGKLARVVARTLNEGFQDIAKKDSGRRGLFFNETIEQEITGNGKELAQIA